MKIPVKILLPLVAQIMICSAVLAQVPKGYKGKPFRDHEYKKGPQAIPGRVELAYYDLGGEGVAYHDTDTVNNGSGKLNLLPDHARPGVPLYIVYFRAREGVDISYTKDFADFNHPNKVDPKVNQLYVGWEDDGEWTNYTVDVKVPGKYRIISVYGGGNDRSTLWLNGAKVVNLLLPPVGTHHFWTQGTVGDITFAKAGLNLLTLKYSQGANLAYLDFILEQSPAGK